MYKNLCDHTFAFYQVKSPTYMCEGLFGGTEINCQVNVMFLEKLAFVMLQWQSQRSVTE